MGACWCPRKDSNPQISASEARRLIQLDHGGIPFYYSNRQGEESKFSSSPFAAARENGGTNFKINYQGKIVPFWLESSSKEQIYSVLAAVAVGVVSGLNLVEISQSLKELTSVTK